MDTLKSLAGQPVSLDEHILRLSDGVIGIVAFGNTYGSDKFSQS